MSYIQLEGRDIYLSKFNVSNVEFRNGKCLISYKNSLLIIQPTDVDQVRFKLFNGSMFVETCPGCPIVNLSVPEDVLKGIKKLAQAS